MKVAILSIVAFFMLGTLGAEELNIFNTHEQKAKPKYEFGITDFTFGKEKSSLPGLTLFVNLKSLKKSNFKIMFAKAFNEAKSRALLKDSSTEKNVLYAELNYRF